MRIVHERGLRLKAWKRGAISRRVIFYMDTGDVFTKFVRRVGLQVAHMQGERADEEDQGAHRDDSALVRQTHQEILSQDPGSRSWEPPPILTRPRRR
jgi:hypothetical protein